MTRRFKCLDKRDDTYFGIISDCFALKLLVLCECPNSICYQKLRLKHILTSLRWHWCLWIILWRETEKPEWLELGIFFRAEYRKDTEHLYHVFVYSLLILLSSIENVMNNDPFIRDFVTLNKSVINYLPRCSYHLL